MKGAATTFFIKVSAAVVASSITIIIANFGNQNTVGAFAAFQAKLIILVSACQFGFQASYMKSIAKNNEVSNVDLKANLILISIISATVIILNNSGFFEHAFFLLALSVALSFYNTINTALRAIGLKHETALLDNLPRSFVMVVVTFFTAKNRGWTLDFSELLLSTQVRSLSNLKVATPHPQFSQSHFTSLIRTLKRLCWSHHQTT